MLDGIKLILVCFIVWACLTVEYIQVGRNRGVFEELIGWWNRFYCAFVWCWIHEHNSPTDFVIVVLRPVNNWAISLNSIACKIEKIFFCMLPRPPLLVLFLFKLVFFSFHPLHLSLGRISEVRSLDKIGFIVGFGARLHYRRLMGINWNLEVDGRIM